ncbi:MAG: hypothetical protein R3A46_17100 [Thermomicrobiales bacterium]
MNDATRSDLTDEAKAQKERVASNVNGVVDKAGQQRERAVEGAHNVADRVRDRASDAPGSDKAAEVAQDAAERVKTGAEYVRDRDFSSMGNAVVSSVKNNPVKAAIAGAIGALLIALKLRSGSDDSESEAQ